MYIDFELHYKDRSSSECLGTALVNETSWLTTNVWMACWSPNFSQGCVAPYEIIWFLKDWISVGPIPNRSNFSWDEPKLSEWSWWKVRRLAHLSLREWDQIVQKRFMCLLQTDTERLKIVSVTNIDLHMRQINW